MTAPFTRRQFIRLSGAAIAGGAWFAARRADAADRPRVVRVSDGRAWSGPGWTDADLDAAVLQGMIARALTELTDEADASAALRALIPGIEGGDQRIGIKVNGVNRDLPTHPRVISALAALLVGAGARYDRIIVFDRTDGDVRDCGLTVRDQGDASFYAYGTDRPGVGHAEPFHMLTHGRVRISSIITERIDHLISVPVLKNHTMAGITGALKNHFGSIDRPQDLHGPDRQCSPGIAEVNALAPIREKTRLALFDACFATHVSGLGGKPDFAPMMVIAAADPVAADAVAQALINQRRAQEQLPALDAQHIKDAASRGLGVADLAAIELVERTLSAVTEKPRPSQAGSSGCGCQGARASGGGAALAAPLLAGLLRRS